MRLKLLSLSLVAVLLLPIFSSDSIPVVQASVPTFETNPSLGIIAGASTGNLAKRIQEFVFKITMENLKRTALNALTSQMITSVTGGNNPSIVGNWQDFYSQNYEKGAQSALEQINPSLHPTLGGNGQGYNPTSFSWDYLDAWRDPGRNYYLGDIVAEDTATLGGYAAAEAAKNEALAGGGFLSTKNDAGQITTTGSVAKDVTSKALTSDIDYIVNAEDLTGFVSALGNSIFNKFIGQAGKGLLGLSDNILDINGGVGDTILDNLSDILNINKTTGQITFNSDANISLLDNALNNIRSTNNNNNGLSLFNNSLFQDATNNTNGSGSSLDSLIDINLPEAKITKEASLDEVQRTIWYLNDIQLAASVVPPSLVNQENINLTKSRLQFMVNNLDQELNNIRSGVTSDSSETRRLNFIEREILRDLYTANMTFSAGGNFDAYDVLPLNLNRSDLPTKQNLNSISTIIYDTDTSVYNSAADNEGVKRHNPVCKEGDGCHFFINSIQYRSGNTSSGTGNFNYLGVNIPKRISETQSVAYFFIYPDRVDNYLTTLNKIITFYESNFVSKKDDLSNNLTSLASLYKYFQIYTSVQNNLTKAANELFTAKLYLADVTSLLQENNNNISFAYENIDLYRLIALLQVNLDTLISDKVNLLGSKSDDLEAKAESLETKLALVNNDGLTALYTAGLDSSPASPQGKLPIISLANISLENGGLKVNDLTKNINQSLLPSPYAGSNLFGSSGYTNTQYYWLANNASPYIISLNTKINNLIKKKVLSNINYQIISETSFLNSPSLTLYQVEPNYHLQFSRFFKDKDVFDRGRLSRGLNRHISKTSLNDFVNDFVLESSYNSNLPINASLNNDQTFINSGWVYRAYNLSNLINNRIDLTLNCQYKNNTYHPYLQPAPIYVQDESFCDIKNIRLVSY